ncbi:MoaD/ThiS family protein [Undibacterium sp. Jales W-56]|uniref:MoaD/ThiS family protein n=1 Tax=Undibacterium sp. Jales W-56 TaxID=2897325 RepID=UPI0021D22597|nr:MoaD/ThiS family protein [Undibacterium sp. Jales W-56]MCU6433355.1 MoaD/ThiS family protein [Undibacterium sp. Jales W-56]
MKIHIKYFASIRETVGHTEETLDLDEDEVTVNTLKKKLAALSTDHFQALCGGRLVRSSVDFLMQDGEFRLRDGCEVAFFPPVTGG